MPRCLRAAMLGAGGLAILLKMPGCLRIALLVPTVGWALMQACDRLLGFLAGWGIARTPKAFRWSIKKIRIRPTLSWWADDSWSVIEVRDWIWHNPVGFNGSFLLKIEKLTLHVELASIYRAIRHSKAIKVDLLLLEGLHFKAQRDQSSLNLWEALDLPDADVNVRSIVQHAQKHGGLEDHTSNADFAGPRKEWSLRNVFGSGARSLAGFRSGAQSSPTSCPARLTRGGAQPGATPLPGQTAKPRKWWPWQRSGGRKPLPRRALQAVQPLPAGATEATRRAAKYWRASWGRMSQAELFYNDRKSAPCYAPLLRYVSAPKLAANRCASSCLAGVAALSPCTGEASWATPRSRGTSTTPAVGDGRFVSSSPVEVSEQPAQEQEYPIGDPRRRPQWGVPLRFDIRHLVALQLQLELLDLLTLSAHHHTHEESAETKMEVESLVVARDRFEAGDQRRKGNGRDRDRGLYLGELVWTLIAELVPIILKTSPSRLMKNAFLATGYALKDSAVRISANVLEVALNAEHNIRHEFGEVRAGVWGHGRECRVHVYLIAGRRITRKGGPVNVRACLELCGPPNEDEADAAAGVGAVLDSAESALRLWTSAPRWDEHFDLGPVTSVASTLKVACFHCQDPTAAKAESVEDLARLTKATGKFLGEVVLQLEALMIRDEVLTAGEIVGWFPLIAAGDACRGAELKLRIRLVGVEGLVAAPGSSATTSPTSLVEEVVAASSTRHLEEV